MQAHHPEAKPPEFHEPDAIVESAQPDDVAGARLTTEHESAARSCWRPDEHCAPWGPLRSGAVAARLASHPKKQVTSVGGYPLQGAEAVQASVGLSLTGAVGGRGRPGVRMPRIQTEPEMREGSSRRRRFGATSRGGCSLSASGSVGRSAPAGVVGPGACGLVDRNAAGGSQV